MRRLATRYAPTLFAFFMSLFMAFIMTGLITVLNTGIQAGVLWRWLRAFLFAWPIAFLCVMVLAGPVRRLVAKLTDTPTH